ncbi:hypothetical protein [Nitrosomonas sp. Nm33]|uniref:hypothetical protein n=1 Tax=Nitrosomonas sp. Nm33 TaxID=133724 RepID=UPI0008945ECD|nr:hypothetical protein [Nitrosomonas sp. Nm33]SDY74354.1 hypothetical protein SAMN05421755_104414 [Nitrosomonas sp. Nm33]
MTFLKLVLFFFFVLLSPDICAQPVPAAKPATATTTTTTKQSTESPSSEESLHELLVTIKETEKERAALSEQLKRTSDPAGVQQIQEQLESLNQRLLDLKNSFEEMVTGGLSLATLTRKSEEALFDWQKELEKIVRPLLDELKQLTERPRRIEQLKSEQMVQEDRLQLADTAIAKLEKALSQTTASSVKRALKELLNQWQEQRENAENRLQRINTQLQRLSTPSDELGEEFVARLQKFASGRGLNLVLALSGFVLIYVALMGLGRIISRLPSRKHEPGTRRLARAIALLLRALTVILASLIAKLILYVRGDWLLLGLMILLMIGLTWGLQKSLPRYIREIRLLLNMGGVREGERILYNGIPWRIASLNLFSTLYNPLLHGGLLRLPIDRLVDLQSRPYSPEEPWFPSQEGDIVILEGDIYGKVLLQTPEIVQIQIIGATTTFSIADYLGKNPRNLSRDGFAIPIIFKLDYQHQEVILTDIVPTLRAYLEEQLAQQSFHPHLTGLLVEFNEATNSSLNLLIVGVFTGAGAEDYWSIHRFLHRTILSACNHYNWVISFDQLTVHLPPAQQPLLPLVNNPT